MVRIINWTVRLEAIDAVTARHLSPGAQGRVDPKRARPAARCHMDPPDLGQQGAIGYLTRALGAASPSGIPRRRDAQHIAHGANLEDIALVRDEAEFHPGASEKMRRVFLESPAPCAGARSRAADMCFRPPDPHRQTGSPRRPNTRAAIPHSPDHRHPARRAASKRQSPAPGQSGSMTGRCSPAAPLPQA
jgi:hypothetical protein